MAEMPLFRKKPLLVSAGRWWKNGDHPRDRVGKREIDWGALAKSHPELLDHNGSSGPIRVPEDAPTYERLEGAVVRFFRHPNYPDDEMRDKCFRTWHDHGWIDTGRYGHTVCPGDWIVEDVGGEYYPVTPDVFARTYEPAAPVTSVADVQASDRDVPATDGEFL